MIDKNEPTQAEITAAIEDAKALVFSKPRPDKFWVTEEMAKALGIEVTGIPDENGLYCMEPGKTPMIKRVSILLTCITIAPIFAVVGGGLMTLAIFGGVIGWAFMQLDGKK